MRKTTKTKLRLDGKVLSVETMGCVLGLIVPTQLLQLWQFDGSLWHVLHSHFAAHFAASLRCVAQ